jgi:hypothetical protein
VRIDYWAAAAAFAVQKFATLGRFRAFWCRIFAVKPAGAR